MIADIKDAIANLTNTQGVVTDILPSVMVVGQKLSALLILRMCDIDCNETYKPYNDFYQSDFGKIIIGLWACGVCHSANVTDMTILKSVIRDADIDSTLEAVKNCLFVSMPDCIAR